jgi:alkylmercury lyase
MIMLHPLFETIITSLVSPETAFEWKLLHRFWRMLADTGTPVSSDALAQALDCPREQVLETLRLYPEADYDPAGNLAGLGLTLHQTPHQMLLGERTFYGWCAPDVLVFPVVLGCTARIVSTCPVTGTSIQLTVTPNHIEDLSPASAAVSIVKDGGMLGQLKAAGCIRQRGCDHQFFFTSQQVVAPWVSEHADFIVLPVEEAFQGLREFARQQQARAAQA